MTTRSNRIAHRIQSFVDNPITNLIKGLALILIGLSDVMETFRVEVSHGHFRLGHGLIIIGLFSILGALPHLIDGLEAGQQFLDAGRKNGLPKNKPDNS